MTPERELEIMHEVIEEAKKSVPEDDRTHPLVGAILTDADGEILCRSHRGYGGVNGHAEFHLFRLAEESGIDTRGKLLFVSLEPCTRRGENKIPCAVRVMWSGVSRIYIGTLDPNVHITGRGEMFLSTKMEVERFPGHLVRELSKINGAFFDLYRFALTPVISPYLQGSDETLVHDAVSHSLASHRDGLLQQSMDLITGSKGEVRLFAGDISWIKELQLSMLSASLQKRRIRVLCDPTEAHGEKFDTAKEIARSLGADVAIAAMPIGARGTLINEDGSTGAMISIERQPSLHGMLLQKPHECGAIEALTCLFDSQWSLANVAPRREPKTREISEQELIQALKEGVPAYSSATISVQHVDTGSLWHLPVALERFKLFRLNQLSTLQSQFELGNAVLIKGSPWPIKPPVIEMHEGRAVIIDGVHRCYNAFSRGQNEITALVVEGVSAELPGEAIEGWNKVEIEALKKPRVDRYVNYRRELFRPIREAFQALSLKF